MTGFVTQNILQGLVRTASWEVLQEKERKGLFLLDVRTPAEFATGRIPGAHKMILADLRDRTKEIPSGREMVVNCRVGLNACNAARINRAHSNLDRIRPESINREPDRNFPFSQTLICNLTSLGLNIQKIPSVSCYSYFCSEAVPFASEKPRPGSHLQKCGSPDGH